MSAHKLTRITATLLFATLACNLILFARTIIFQNGHFTFLNWNLFLAWVPFISALGAAILSTHHRKLSPQALVLLFIWFIFYPNAPYIVTDLLHISGKNQLLLLFDVITVFSYASTGLTIGFASLDIAQGLVRHYYGQLQARIFIICVLTLGSLGVYLGRFLRWNSWEVITHPLSLARDLFGTIVNPHIYTESTIVFTIVFTIFSTSLYLVYHSLSAHRD